MQPTHNFGATYQQGIVSAVDAAKHRLRVKFPAMENFESDWLPMLTLAAGGNQFYSLPDEGELVSCLLDAHGETGIVLGAIYNDQDPTPASSNDIWMKKFSNGTVIQHDRTTGDVSVITTGKVTVDAPDAIFTGNVTVEKQLTYLGGMAGSGGADAAAIIEGSIKQRGGDFETDGDVKAGDISVKGHDHEAGVGKPK